VRRFPNPPRRARANQAQPDEEAGKRVGEVEEHGAGSCGVGRAVCGRANIGVDQVLGGLAQGVASIIWPPDPGGAGVSDSVRTCAPIHARGGRVTVYGGGFQPVETVDIRVHATVVGSATIYSSGKFTQQITIPESAPPPGFPTDISATGRSSIKTGSAPFSTS
jgi:hypothetical protein